MIWFLPSAKTDCGKLGKLIIRLPSILFSEWRNCAVFFSF